MTGASAEPARLRVVTWNIRAAIGPGEPFPPAWWRHVRRDRLARIAAFVVGVDADVVTLQEVTIMTPDGEIHDQPAELARLTGRSVRYAATHAFPLIEPESGRAIGAAMWGNAVLTRRPLDDGFGLGLPQPADDDMIEPPAAYGDTEPGHREPRCAVGGTVDGIAVATAHLTYIGRDQRRRQAEALLAVADGLPGPAIVTGDFNAPLVADELAPLRVGLVDAFAAVGISPGDPARVTSGGSAIDHVLLRGLTVDACRVATEAGDLSDHWPVIADLRLA